MKIVDARTIVVGTPWRELAFRELVTEWIDEPVAPENPRVMARVRAGTRLTIATGERAHTAEVIRPLIEDGLVDVVQVDLTHYGGFLPMKRLAGWADAYALPMALRKGLRSNHEACAAHRMTGGRIRLFEQGSERRGFGGS
jgi:L-alanine-DL-glutamate epimerase-like enolase superfamily enzyme